MRRLHVDCFAWGSENGWEAICIDLDIAVQGKSFDAVYHSLNDAVLDYVETVMQLPMKDRERLLNRRAPFWTRARIQAGFWFAMLRKLFRHDTGEHGSFPVNVEFA